MTCTLPGSSRWYPYDLRKIDSQGATQSCNPLNPYSSSWSPSGGFLSPQNGQLADKAIPALFGSNQTVSDRLFLAVFLSHHHRDVLLPFPSWFSVRLFEDASFTPKRFRKLRKIMNRKMRQDTCKQRVNEETCSLPDRLSVGHHHCRHHSSPDPTTIDTDRLSITYTRRGSPSECSTMMDQSKNDSFFIDDPIGHTTDEIDTGLSMGHLVPPPWTCSLDLWKSKFQV